MSNWLQSWITHEATAIGVGGALGANARYWVGQWIKSTAYGKHFPWGTLLVNVSGSILLAAMFVLFTEKCSPPQKRWLLLLGTGFCGSYTTFSTFTVETIALFEEGRFWAAAGYVLLSVSGGLFAVIFTFRALRSFHGCE